MPKQIDVKVTKPQNEPDMEKIEYVISISFNSKVHV